MEISVVAKKIKANNPISSCKAKYQGTAIILIPCAIAEIELAKKSNRIALRFFIFEIEAQR